MVTTLALPACRPAADGKRNETLTLAE